MRLKFLTLLSTVILLVNVSAVPVKADGGFAIGAVVNFSSFDTDGKEWEQKEGYRSISETTSYNFSAEASTSIVRSMIAKCLIDTYGI